MTKIVRYFDVKNAPLLKKSVSKIIVFILLATCLSNAFINESLVMVQAQPVMKADCTTLGFMVQNSTTEAGAIQYKIEDEQWKNVTLSENTGTYPEGGNYSYLTGSVEQVLTQGTKVFVKVIPSQEYQLDKTRGVIVRAGGQEDTTIAKTVEDDIISETGFEYTLSENTDYEFELGFEQKQSDPGSGGDEPHPNVNIPAGYILVKDIEGNYIDYDSTKASYGYLQYSENGGNSWSDLSASDTLYSVDGGANWTTLQNPQQTDSNLLIAYKIPESSVSLRAYSLQNYTSSFIDSDGHMGDPDTSGDFHGLLKQDGTIISDTGLSPEEVEEGIKSGIYQSVRVCYSDIDISKGYCIGFNPHNISWFNDADYAMSTGAGDAVVTNGTVEFVSCLMPDGTDGLVNGLQNGPQFRSGTNEIVGYGYSAREGAVLTLKFIPDYGYQFKEASINGNPVTPSQEDYTFRFKFPQGTFHMSVTFEKGQDKVSGEAAGVGTVTEVAADERESSIHGNLILNGSQANVSEDLQQKVHDTVSSDMEVADNAYIDLTLKSYAEKGASNECWTQNLTETSQPVKVTIAVNQELKQQIENSSDKCSVIRVHENANGEISYSELDAIYDKENNTISFNSDSFSTFAIATGKSAHTHQAKGAWEMDESKHWHKCTCGARIDEADHVFGQWQVTKEADVLNEGEMTRSCSVCGYKETKKIDKVIPTVSLGIKGNLPLQVKQTYQLKANNLAKGDSVKSWESSNTKIVTVSKNGKMKGVKKGTAVVTVVLNSGKKASVKVKVQKSVVKTTKISINLSKNLTLKKGKKVTIKSVITPVTSKQKVTFTSSDTKIVKVNSKGVLKAVKKGKAVITIKSGSVYIKIKVTVK